MQSNIRKAFDKKLVGMPNGLGIKNTAFENASFKPKNTDGYQQTKLTPLPVENPTFGGNYHREVGFYQVTLSYPAGGGVSDIVEMADKIKDYFKRSTLLIEGTDKIIVDRTPDISSTYINETRVELNIRIRYYSEQFQ